MKLTQYSRILNSGNSMKMPGIWVVKIPRAIIFIVIALMEEGHKDISIKIHFKGIGPTNVHTTGILIKNIKIGILNTIREIIKHSIHKEDIKHTKNSQKLSNNFIKVKDRDKPIEEDSNNKQSSMRDKDSSYRRTCSLILRLLFGGLLCLEYSFQLCL